MKSEVRLGEGVYFHPVVRVESTGMDADEERRNFEDFLELAQSVTECFASNGPEVRVKLDAQFCQDVWDASAVEADASFRVDWAMNELCDILEKTPVAGLGAGVELLDQEIWRSAKRVLLTQLMDTGVVQGLTFACDPPLPEGLSLAESTGIISGHPSEACQKQTYQLVCSSELGQVECGLEMEIVEAAAPQQLEYKGVQRAYACRQPMVIMPKVAGLVTTWTIRPALPKGLRHDSVTGTICGIPQEPQGETTWTVIAKNELGSTTTKVTFEIAQAAPTNLRYHADEHTDFAADRLGFCGRQAAQTFPVNRWMCLRPTIDGSVDAFEVSPPLPEGIAFNTETGEISGTPTVETPTTPYTILARNAGGLGKVMVLFAIKNLPTIGISYPAFDDVYCVGEEIDCEPMVQGGATTWTSDPQLPHGLVLDAKMGKIVGVCSKPFDEASYTITASNEVGGTSCVLTFMVIAMPPEGLSYLEMLSEYFVGEEVLAEPDLLCGEGNVTYVVSPDLPSSLSMSAETGTISGTPNQETCMSQYRVEASNSMGRSSCVIEFQIKLKPTSNLLKASSFARSSIATHRSVVSVVTVKVPDTLPAVTESEEEEGVYALASAADNVSQGSAKRNENELNDFIQNLQNVEDPKLLPPEPNKASNSFQWMLWAAHRAKLCDPTLTTLSFKGLEIPLPDVEPRIIGKLVQAIAANRHLVSLDLSATGLRAPQVSVIAQALRANQALQILNLDNNWLDSTDVEGIIDALDDNQNSKLTVLLCSDQLCGYEFGRGTEEKLAAMLERNTKITKCSIPVEDPHWKSLVERALKRNADQTKRNAKMKINASSKVEERALASLVLHGPPHGHAMDVFKGSCERFQMARLFTCEKTRLPTKEQLQAFARNRGQPLKYAEVAPVLRAFRTTLLDALAGTKVVALDSTRKAIEGSLKAWSEKNDRWSVEVVAEAGAYRFICTRDPVLGISPTIAQWLSDGWRASSTE